MNTEYYNKYLKYKNKYLELKNQMGGEDCREYTLKKYVFNITTPTGNTTQQIYYELIQNNLSNTIWFNDNCNIDITESGEVDSSNNQITLNICSNSELINYKYEITVHKDKRTYKEFNYNSYFTYDKLKKYILENDTTSIKSLHRNKILDEYKSFIFGVYTFKFNNKKSEKIKSSTVDIYTYSSCNKKPAEFLCKSPLLYTTFYVNKINRKKLIGTPTIKELLLLEEVPQNIQIELYQKITDFTKSSKLNEDSNFYTLIMFFNERCIGEYMSKKSSLEFNILILLMYIILDFNIDDNNLSTYIENIKLLLSKIELPSIRSLFGESKPIFILTDDNKYKSKLLLEYLMGLISTENKEERIAKFKTFRQKLEQIEKITLESLFEIRLNASYNER